MPNDVCFLCCLDADLSIVTPDAVTFGTNTSVFVKVEPDYVKPVPLQYYLMDEKCENVIYNLTSTENFFVK